MPLSRMPLLRYRPCLPYTLQRYVSDVWLSLCFLLISLSSSPFLLWPHPETYVPAYLPTISLSVSSSHPFTYSHTPLAPSTYPSPFAPLFNSRLPTHLFHLLPAHRYRPSFQLTPPRSSLLRLIPPPTYLASNSPLLQLTFPPTHLSSNSPKTYLRYRDH